MQFNLFANLKRLRANLKIISQQEQQLLKSLFPPMFHYVYFKVKKKTKKLAAKDDKNRKTLNETSLVVQPALDYG